MNWIFPIQGSYRLTQRFGGQLMNYAQFGLKGHDGIDYAAVRGTPVVAPDDGLVVESYGKAKPNAGGYGNVVRMLTPRDSAGAFYEQVFGHFLTVFVEVGDRITRGTLIGLVDSTGFSSGDHLHWGVRKVTKGATGSGTFKQYQGETYVIDNYDNGYFGYIDQAALIAGEPENLLPVDVRYGQPASGTREWLWKVKNEAYAKKRAAAAQLPYDDRLMKAFTYGYWDADFVFEVANFAVWANMTKPEFERVKKVGRTGTFITDMG